MLKVRGAPDRLLATRAQESKREREREKGREKEREKLRLAPPTVYHQHHSRVKTQVLTTSITSEQKGNNFKGLKDPPLKAKARIWP